MKKIFIWLILVLSFAQSFSQDNDTTQYTYYKFAYGNRLDRYWSTKVLMIPKDTIWSKDGLALKAGTLYTGNGIKWSSVASGAGAVDSFMFATRGRLQKTLDSMVAVNNARYLKPADTNNFKLRIDTIAAQSFGLHIKSYGATGDTLLTVFNDSIIKQPKIRDSAVSGQVVRHVINPDSSWTLYNLPVVANSGASKSISAGTLSARPAASNCQCYYFSTTDSTWSYDNGAWIPMKGGSGGGGSSQTLQQVLTTGSTLTKKNTSNFSGFRQYDSAGLQLLDSAAILPSIFHADSVTFFGTSITFGIGTSFPDNYSTITANKFDALQSNYGISGASLTIAGIADTSFIPAYSTIYRWAVLEWGVNDMQLGVTDSTTFSNTYKLYLDAWSRRGWDITKKIIVLQNGIVDITVGSATTARQLQFRRAINAVVAAKGITHFVDIYDAEVAQGGLAMLKDGIHPNAYGTALYAQQIFAAVTDSVPANNQSLAINGLTDLQRLKIRVRGIGDYRSQVMATDSAGNVVGMPRNAFAYSTTNPNVTFPQAGGINMGGVGIFKNIHTDFAGNPVSDSLGGLYVQGATFLNGALTTNTDALINGITAGHGLGGNTSNTAFGANALGNNSGENGNTGVGGATLQNDVSGFFNTAIGYQALVSNNSGIENTAIGVQALNSVTGSGNVAIGSQAGSAATSVSNKLYIANSSSNNLLYGDFSTGQAQTGQLGSSPSLVATAAFEVKSITMGFLPPRMTTTQMNAISSPATGLLVWNSDSLDLCKYTGTAWRIVGLAGVGGSPPFDANMALLKDHTDATKLWKVDISAFPTATTRTETKPNANFTTAGINIAQAWTQAQDMTAGTLTVATQAVGDNSTKAASTAYADAASSTAFYTSTLTNTTNISSSAFFAGLYTRVHNSIHVNFSTFTITPTASSATTVLTFTLPFTASYPGGTVVIGQGVVFQGSSILPGYVSQTSTTTGTFTFFPTSTSTWTGSLSFDIGL